MASSVASDPGLREVGRDYLVIVGGHLIAGALGVVTVVLATRLLGPAGYGEVAVAVAAMQLVYVLGVHWTMAGVIRFGREALSSGVHAGRAVGSALAVILAAAVVSLGAWALAAPTWRRWAGASAGMAAGVAVLLVAVVGSKFQEHVLQMASRMGMYSLGRVGGKVATIGVLVGLLVRGTAWPGAVVLAMATGFAVQALTAIPVVRRLRPLSFELGAAAAAAAYGAPLIVRSGAGYLLDWMDLYWLRTLRGPAEVGVYQVAYQWMLAASELLSGVAILGFPLLTAMRARGEHTGVRRYAERALPQIAVTATLVLMIVAFAAGLVVPVLLGERFEAVAPLLSLLLVAGAFQVAIYGTGPLFASHDLLRPASAIIVGMALVNLAADAALVPAWGMFGAATATCVTYAVGAALHAALLRRRFGVAVGSLLIAPWFSVLPAVVTLVGVPAWVRGAALIAAAGALITWARARRLFTPEDLAAYADISLPPPLRSALRTAWRWMA